jgi:hypothetical protein
MATSRASSNCPPAGCASITGKKGVGWIEAPNGAFDLGDFMPGYTRPVSAKDAARLGCRLEDFGPHWTDWLPEVRAGRAKLALLLKERSFDLAASRVRPGHA